MPPVFYDQLELNIRRWLRVEGSSASSPRGLVEDSRHVIIAACSYILGGSALCTGEAAPPINISTGVLPSYINIWPALIRLGSRSSSATLAIPRARACAGWGTHNKECGDPSPEEIGLGEWGSDGPRLSLRSPPIERFRHPSCISHPADETRPFAALACVWRSSYDTRTNPPTRPPHTVHGREG